MDRFSCGGTGPCRKRFHPECAGFRNLSLDQLSYLLWFCDPCQRELPMLRIALQRLAQVRRTCHRWKAVVDGSTVLSRKFMLDRDYEPSCLPPAVEAVKLCRARIVAVDPWWSSLGEKLVEISLDNCIISVTRLASMLQHAPNLKSIELDCLDVGVVMNEWSHCVTVANFWMNQMDKLVLHQCARTIRKRRGQKASERKVHSKSEPVATEERASAEVEFDSGKLIRRIAEAECDLQDSSFFTGAIEKILPVLKQAHIREIHISSEANANDSLAAKYITAQFRKFETTEQQHCRAKEEMQFAANTYLCYLESVRKLKELNAAYSGRGERSIRETADMVGFKLPHDPK
ncbi:hypothetical protein pipiens_006129 [Culex pipiens pipiens]|uniref:Protein FMC1 homolog n=1 Tax=Culex pipiens pipiens TaxID=38569 RepID=A0ABD1DRV7_CULPP